MLQGPWLLLLAAAEVFAPPLAAQDTAEGGGASEITEEIVVTGSRIKRRDFTSPSPLASIDREAILFTGQPSLEETLNQMPQVVPDFGRTSNNPGDGTARVNLRGLGAGRTLVLLNGRRLAPSGVGSAVDVNNLPQVLIERVEIITGGAATVYGSDAVAGVVNFVTREELTGLHIDASVNVTEENDAEVVNASVAWGFDAWEGGGHFIVYADYLEREALLAGARDLTRVTLANVDSDGTLVESGSPVTPSGVIFFPSVDFGSGQPWVTFDENGNPRQFLDPQDQYNFQPVNYLQTPLTRGSVGAMGWIDIGGDLEFYFETAFAHNETVQQLAPIPAGTFAEVSTQSPFLSTEAQQFFADNYEVAPGLSQIGIGRRLVEVGPRIIENERDYWRTVVGLRGRLGAGWDIDGWLTYTDASESGFLRNDASASRFVQGLLVDPVTGACVDPSGGCVPVDVFGPGQLSEEAANFLRIDKLENETERTQILASVFVRGALIEGWAGPVETAIGLEWRSDDASFEADDVLFTGDTLAYRGAAPVEGRESVTELYAEALIPLARDAGWADHAALEVGSRYSNYENAGGVWTWKLGGEWQPMEGARFRGMRQRSVRAPNNEELFTEQFSEGAGSILVGADDPCSASADPIGSGNAGKCTIQGLSQDQLGVFEATGVPIEVIRGGNPDLDPEVAETWTVGAVLTPRWLPDWTIAVDFFDLEVEKSIGAIDAFAICFDAQNTGALFCENLRRDPVSGNVIEIFEPFSNRGLIATRGIDTQLNYETGLPRWLEFSGPATTLTLDLTWSHVLEYRWQENPATQIIECAGFFGSFCSFAVDNAAFSVVPDNRVTTNLNYASGPLSVHLTWRWIDGTSNSEVKRATFFQEPEPALAIPEIGGRHYLDLGVGYQLTDQITVRFGIENLTDTDPPNMADAAQENNTDAGIFDVFGRTYHLSMAANLFPGGR
jgi:outer membrane receptor protein involved in Fe transport